MVQNVTWWKHKLKFWWMDVPVRGRTSVFQAFVKYDYQVPLSCQMTITPKSEIAMHSLLQKIDVVISLSSLTAWHKNGKIRKHVFLQLSGKMIPRFFFGWWRVAKHSCARNGSLYFFRILYNVYPIVVENPRNPTAWQILHSGGVYSRISHRTHNCLLTDPTERTGTIGDQGWVEGPSQVLCLWEQKKWRFNKNPNDSDAETPKKLIYSPKLWYPLGKLTWAMENPHFQ